VGSALPAWIAEAVAEGGGWLDAAKLTRALAESRLEGGALALALLPVAAARAHAPVSGFEVGAVALATMKGGSEALALGANLEFVGAPLEGTVHAEQAAVHLARSHGAQRLRALALSTAPCGHCRQFLQETEGAEDLQVLLEAGGDHRLVELLPHSFGPEALGKQPALFGGGSAALRLRDDSSDALVRDAFEAACLAYAPYSRSPAGAAVLRADGRSFTGCSLESAAFNPSLGALAAALSRMAMARTPGEAFAPPVRAVLVEAVGLASQRVLSEALLGAFAPRLALEVHAAERA